MFDDDFTGIVFPLVRELGARLVAEDIVSVQPMTEIDIDRIKYIKELKRMLNRTKRLKTYINI